MRGFLMTVIAGAAVALFLAPGCGKKDNPASTTPNAVGTWKSTISGATMTVVISADNTFSMDAPGTNGTIGNYSLSGTYTLSKDTITFTSMSCALSGEGCPCIDPNPGIISGNQITMPIPYGNGTKTTLTRQ